MDEQWNKIRSIDLELIRQKFLSQKAVWWRFKNSSQRVEQQYRQFLYLIVTHPGQTVVPWSRDLDDFWHVHILDTAKYAKDCQTILGQFIHHNPHLPEGSPAHTRGFAATRQMYKAAFRQSVLKGKKRTSDDIGCGADMAVVFCAGGTAVSVHHESHQNDHSLGHHDAGGHPAGHGCGGHGGGHGCGGHH